MSIDLIKIKILAVLAIVLFFCIPKILSAQAENAAARPFKSYGIFVSDDLPKMDTTDKVLDTLIKLNYDKEVIKFSLTGNASKIFTYQILGDKGGLWSYWVYNNKPAITVNNIPDSVSKCEEFIHSNIVFITGVRTNATTLQENYGYIIVIKNKIVKMLQSDFPIEEAANFKNITYKDLPSFLAIENYLSLQQRRSRDKM